MSFQISKVDVWQGQIPDKPGTLGKALAALGQSGADLGYALAKRDDEAPGNSIVFITPLKGAKQTKAAAAIGFRKSTQFHVIRVAGVDRPGLASEVAAALGDAGVNIHELTGTVLGKQVVIHVKVDSKADASKAVRTIRKVK